MNRRTSANTSIFDVGCSTFIVSPFPPCLTTP
jgi:hypothetical protein